MPERKERFYWLYGEKLNNTDALYHINYEMPQITTTTQIRKISFS